MPTFQLFRGGVKVAEFSGADEKRLRALLRQHGAPPTSIPQRTKVRVFGLKARPEVNGREGVVGSFDAAKGRYAVALKESADAAAETLALKRDNLVQQLPVEIRLPQGGEAPEGLAAADRAVLRSFDAEALSYSCTLQPDGRAAEAVPLGSVLLPTGTTGAVIGLQGAAEHNGKSGVVTDYDEASDRYLVTIDASLQLRLKRANLRA